MKPGAIVLFSGGIDSTTLLYYWHHKGYEVRALTVDYGQRHKRELLAARRIASLLGVRHDILEVPIGPLLASSALTNPDIAVPDGEYAPENINVTIVPNRNAVLLSLAYAVAVSDGAALVSFAAHDSDRLTYPDCRYEFVTALETAFRIGNDGLNNPNTTPEIVAPFLAWDKGQIVKWAVENYVPLADTYSCYKGGEFHCGTCATCRQRREAFVLAGVLDQTIYLENTPTL